jgi:tetratricopeptide (TPR) repeat protein
MGSGITRNILTISVVMLLIIGKASAQNKDVDKGKATLAKAMEQKDASKRQELINTAREDFQKGGLKPQEVAIILGDTYLDKGDLVNAANSYSTASKEDKKAGFKKVADAYVETAFNGDEKAENKAVNKAMDYYKKADALKEGARNIGDKYYGKGIDGYSRAIDFYLIGDAQVKLEAIAKEYFDKGGESENKAAEVYMRMKTPEGDAKAGDIYFNRKEYAKAIDAYEKGNSADGIKKYADYLYSQNKNDDADNYYVKIAAIYATSHDDAALEKLATESQKKGSYGLAARIYDKAGNTTLSDKSNGYAELIAFNLDSAKIFFNNVNDAGMVKAIDDNTKVLNALKDIADNFDEVMKAAPFVTMITDSVTGQSTPSANDQRTLEDYYKSVRDQIVKNVYDVSANMAKLKSDDLKKYARIRFLRYGAIRKILNTETFTIVKQKADIKAKDVVL